MTHENEKRSPFPANGEDMAFTCGIVSLNGMQKKAVAHLPGTTATQNIDSLF